MLTSSATSSLSTPSPSAAQLAHAERRARRFWVSLIVGLLGLQVLIGFGSIWLSLGDPTVAVVPNYHQKALDWDTTRRARQLTKTLGWQISPIVGVLDPDKHQRLVRIAIRDRSGKVVSNLNVSAQVYHHARGANIHELRFTETDPGYYEAAAGLAEAGLWELQLQMEGAHGVASEVRDLIVE
jgi:nitrogen fixation protein FixH